MPASSSFQIAHRPSSCPYTAEPVDCAALCASLRIHASEDFQEELRRRLKSWGDRVVLRILTSRSESDLMELTANQVLERSLELADRYLIAPERGVVLLLLPHSVELFLLHIGLVLMGRVPAILAWPTNRVDPDKYQRNVLQQLRDLPASLLVTVPALTRKLEPGLPYPVTACPIASADPLNNALT